MKVVALTGGIGSGKSAACKVFEQLDVPVVDVDAISHALTAVDGGAIPQIRNTFGDAYLTAAGALNRQLMRELVFDNANAREQLNAILHPAIYQDAIAALDQHADVDYQVLAIPLLDADSQYLKHIDHVLVIDCEESTQIARVMTRNGLSETAVKKIMAAQISRAERLALADTVIENNHEITDFEQSIANFHQNYVKTCIVSK